MDRRKFLKFGLASTAMLTVPTVYGDVSNGIEPLGSATAGINHGYIFDNDVEFMYPHKIQAFDFKEVTSLTYKNSVISWSKLNLDIDLTSPILKELLSRFDEGTYNAKVINYKKQADLDLVFCCCILHDAYMTDSNILVTTKSQYIKRHLHALLDNSSLDIPDMEHDDMWVFQKSIIDFNQHEVDDHYEIMANKYEEFINLDQNDEPLRHSSNRIVYHMHDGHISMRTKDTYHPDEIQDIVYVRTNLHRALRLNNGSAKKYENQLALMNLANKA